ncbi:hypothetical protein Acid7E03_41370 [Acidisoma sp. 7E03]
MQRPKARSYTCRSYPCTCAFATRIQRAPIEIASPHIAHGEGARGKFFWRKAKAPLPRETDRVFLTVQDSFSDLDDLLVGVAYRRHYDWRPKVWLSGQPMPSGNGARHTVDKPFRAGDGPQLDRAPDERNAL